MSSPVTTQPEGGTSAANQTTTTQTLKDGGKVTVRCLRDSPEDAEFAARMLVDAFRGKYIHNVTEEKLDIVLKILNSQHRGNPPEFYTRNFVAEYDGRPAGLVDFKLDGDPAPRTPDHRCELGCYRCCRYACFSCNMDERPSGDKCYLDHICVDPAFRGKGIGKALMDHVESEARRLKCSMIYLYVTTTNRARHLYERQGYEVTTTTTCCIDCLFGEPGVHKMEKPLR